MFVGHYGPAFAGAAAPQRVPLWVLFVAVQLVDYAWSALVLGGVERATITPGFTAMSPLELEHMPYTHSLVASLVWAVAAGAAFALIARRGLGVGLIVAAAVFSHWLADLLVHVPDLAIWPGGPKVGLGWWRSWPLGLGAEAGVLLIGFAIYMRATTPNRPAGRWAPWAFLALLIAVEAVNLLGPPPGQAAEVAVSALAAYTVLALAAAGLDWSRRLRAAQP